MRRVIGPILALLGVGLIVSLVAGLAYSAGLANAGVVTTTGSTVVAPVGYGWWGWPWFGFGLFHFLAFLFVIVLIVGLIRLAVGGGRGPRGWGYGHGYGPGAWRGGPEAGGPGTGGKTSGDPREAWIRARLDEWHRTAHAASGSESESFPARPATAQPPTAQPPTDRPPTAPPVPGR